ncbi:PucR family transcriptional regulator [Streptomyces chartreusis]|uniref:PucR family transcriptional regulator n=1 Tax=Streptomyces chartreusis TaxID=1969 RepID=UPI0036D86543
MGCCSVSPGSIPGTSSGTWSGRPWPSLHRTVRHGRGDGADRSDRRPGRDGRRRDRRRSARDGDGPGLRLRRALRRHRQHPVRGAGEPDRRRGRGLVRREATEVLRWAFALGTPGRSSAATRRQSPQALDVAQRMGFDDPLLRAADLLVFPVLARDRQALVDLVRSTLSPLEQARGGAQPLLDTLTAYFDTGCVAAETARRLALSVRALTYRLDRIHTLTGTNPADPAHRYTLQTAVIGARLLDWPGRPL